MNTSEARETFTGRSDWIWIRTPADENTYAEFRSRFAAEGGEATLRISAEGAYEAFLNGKWLPSSQCADLPMMKAVSCVPLATRTGENELLVRVWYQGEDTSVSRREPAGLRFEVCAKTGKMLAFSCADTQARIDARYHNGPIEPFTPQMGASFRYVDAPPHPW